MANRLDVMNGACWVSQGIADVLPRRADPASALCPGHMKHAAFSQNFARTAHETGLSLVLGRLAFASLFLHLGFHCHNLPSFLCLLITTANCRSKPFPDKTVTLCGTIDQLGRKVRFKAALSRQAELYQQCARGRQHPIQRRFLFSLDQVRQIG